MTELNQSGNQEYLRISDVLGEAVKTLQGGSEMQDRISQLSVELEQLRTTSEDQAGAVGQNTRAVLDNTVAQVAQVGGSALAETGRSLVSVFSSGLGFSPLISGLAHLFGGGAQVESPAPLVPYPRPSPIEFDMTYGGGFSQESLAAKGSPAGPQASPNANTGTSITIAVQALDARSILDRGDDIARAVRMAMLNSNALNDVVTEL